MGNNPIQPAPRFDVETFRLRYLRELYATGAITIADLEQQIETTLRGYAPTVPHLRVTADGHAAVDGLDITSFYTTLLAPDPSHAETR